jgi:hypothetical protein
MAGGVATGAAVTGTAAALRLSPQDAFDRVLAVLEPGGRVPAPSGSTLLFEKIRSRVLQEDVEYGVAEPPGCEVGRPLPLAVCLPGRGSNPRSVLSAELHYSRPNVGPMSFAPSVLPVRRSGPRTRR